VTNLFTVARIQTADVLYCPFTQGVKRFLTARGDTYSKDQQVNWPLEALSSFYTEGYMALPDTSRVPDLHIMTRDEETRKKLICYIFRKS